MTPSYLKIFLENNSLCIGKVEGEGLHTKLIIDIEMSELTSLRPEDAAYKIGGTVLNVLRLWHKDEFGEWQVPPIFEPPSR